VSIVVLTGGPGAGKSTIARAVAPLRNRCAVIEVDDLRQMLVKPHVAPWDGVEGRRQQRLGVANAAAVAIAFADDGCDVVVADVLTNATAALYRTALSPRAIMIVHLRVPLAMAQERALTRHYTLTGRELLDLHNAQGMFGDFDMRIDTSATSVPGAARAICDVLDQPAADSE
jgi:chloramphenicol 3-O-phosphotransferase